MNLHDLQQALAVLQMSIEELQRQFDVIKLSLDEAKKQVEKGARQAERLNDWSYTKKPLSD